MKMKMNEVRRGEEKIRMTLKMCMFVGSSACALVCQFQYQAQNEYVRQWFARPIVFNNGNNGWKTMQPYNNNEHFQFERCMGCISYLCCAYHGPQHYESNGKNAKQSTKIVNFPIYDSKV